MTPHKVSLDTGVCDNDRDIPTMFSDWLLSNTSGLRTIWPWPSKKMDKGPSEEALVKFKSCSAHQK